MVGFALARIKLLTYIVHLKGHFRITVLFPTNFYENPHSKLFKIFPFCLNYGALLLISLQRKEREVTEMLT